MKNSGAIKILIVILAIVAVGLFILFTVKTLNPKEESAMMTDDVANYGMVTEEPEEESEMIETANGNFYSVDDGGTMEMDEIPNDAGAPEALPEE